MKQRTKRGLVAFSCLAALAVSNGSALATWSLTDLGTLGGLTTNANGINNVGQVAGVSKTSGGVAHPFLWSEGVGMQDLGVLGGGTLTSAKALNNLGQAVGNTYPTGGAKYHATLWSVGTIPQDLGTLSGVTTDVSYAYAINDAGHIAGKSYYSNGGTNSHAFFYKDSAMLDIGALDGTVTSIAYGINNHDQVVGDSTYSGGGTSFHAFIWDSVNGMRELPNGTSGRAINDAGDIVGIGIVPPSTYQAVLWKNGVLTPLQLLSDAGSSSSASSINNNGQIVGYCNTNISGNGYQHAVLWSDGRIIDLSVLPVVNKALETAIATGVNDSGQMVFSSTPSGGSTRSYILTQNLKVTKFVLPAASQGNLPVPVTTFEATDSVGVTGYMITESPTAPLITDTGWTVTPPTQFTYSAVGNNAYAWVTDAEGNVSFGVKATTPAPADTTPPNVTFTAPSTSTSLTVPVTFTATDDTGVTGYLLTESATAPLPGDAGWLATAPANYTFTGYGAKTLYAWARDAAGNVSTGASASISVDKATATLTLGGLTTTYDGTPKSATFTCDQAGVTVTVTYDGSPTAPTNAGTYAVVATVNDANYQGTASGSLTISKATPAITWNSPADITYGTLLDASQLNAIPSTTGSVVYSPASGTRLNAGNQTLTVDFTPTDTNNYTSTTKTVQINVAKASATLTLGNVTFTYDGTGKAATATATPAGLNVAVTYDGSANAPINAGTYVVVATISDPNYQGSTSGSLTIAKAATSVTWANPAEIVYGNALGATQLNATASLAGGSFSYTPAAGTILNPGYQTLSVLYTPADATNYTTATGTATIRVLPNGDMDGKGGVTIADALMMLRCAVGLYTPDALEKARGDVAPLVNGKPDPNGTIDISDALIILKRVVNLISW